MNSNESLFKMDKPKNYFLSTFIDSFFYVDSLVSDLNFTQENILPFPRVTFGYFFNHPFKVTNHTKNIALETQMNFSKVSNDQVTVEPLTDRIKIVGFHAKVHAISYFTNQKIGNLDWFINAEDIFKNTNHLQEKLNQCNSPEEMFDTIEDFLQDQILVKDLTVICKTIEIIETERGIVNLQDLSLQLNISDRTLRNLFFDTVGCSPKEFINAVRIKTVAFDLANSKRSMTEIAYDNEFFDQAHFNHTIKKITGSSPKKIKKEIPDFRFLQF